MLNQNLQQTKASYEHKMKHLAVELAGREAQITDLEMRLKSVAYGEQSPVLDAQVISLYFNKGRNSFV